MADETRRSGRANKGHHSHKDKEIPDSTPAKPKKGAKKGSRASKNTPEQTPSDNEGGDDVIRCICGATTDEQDGSMMICCDICQAWQHNVCMGLKGKTVPDHFYCEICRPEEHADLFHQVNVEGKSMLQVAAERIATAPKGTRKPALPAGYEHLLKAMKGRKSIRASHGMPASDDTPNSSTIPQSSPAPTELKTGIKRQYTADEPAHNGQHEVTTPTVPPAEPTPPKPAKRIRSSIDAREPEQQPPPSATQSADTPGDDLVDKPATGADQLPDERRKPTMIIAETIADKIREFAADQSFSQDGAYRIPDGETATSLGERFAVAIERTLFDQYGSVKGSWGQQIRSLRVNIKKNGGLTKGLLDNSLSPSKLALMTSDEMLDDETKKKDAKIRELAERQAFAIQEDGPRLIVDHKGPRYLDVDGQNDAVFQSLPTTTTVRRESEVQNEERTSSSQSNEAHSPMEVELPEDVGAQERPPLTVDTSAQPHGATAQRSSSAQNFDINAIYSKLPQNNSEVRPLQQPARRRSSAMHRQSEQRNVDDPDIDRLLDEPDIVDSSVWKGRVDLPHMLQFNARAVHVAGAPVPEGMPQENILARSLVMSGRIPIPDADRYILNMKHSTSNDVIVLQLLPKDEDEKPFMRGLFNYFKEKQRWGVVQTETLPPTTRDAYVVTLDEGEDPLPDFLQAIDGHTLDQPRTEPMLLLVAIVRFEFRRFSQSGTMSATPARPLDTPIAPIADSPFQGAPFQQSTPQQSQYSNGIYNQGLSFSQAPVPMSPASLARIPENARRILGECLQYPILQTEEMKSAIPHMQDNMLENLAHILTTRPEVRNDMKSLSEFLSSL